MSSNRIRMFADVLAIDAWHSPFSQGSGSASVHVEVTFKEGRMGGADDDFPFTFRVALKKAILSVRVEAPLEIDRKSVARNIPDTHIQQTRIRTVRDTMRAEGRAGLSINPMAFAGALAGKVAAAREQTDEQITKVSESLPPILVASEPRGRNEYAWALEPTYAAALLGQPWDPLEEPRLSAKGGVGRRISIDPVIDVKLTCALEDLEVGDIRLKSDSFSDKFSQFLEGDPRVFAAQQHIKKVLKIASLEPGAMDNRFAAVVIASVLAAQG